MLGSMPGLLNRQAPLARRSLWPCSNSSIDYNVSSMFHQTVGELSALRTPAEMELGHSRFESFRMGPS